MQINLLVLNEPEPYGGVTWWRMYRPLVELERRCPDIRVIWNRGMINYADIMSADVVIAFRPSEQSQLNVISTVADFGKPLIFDYDDDLFTIPQAHGDYDTLGVKVPVIMECLKYCAQIWVTNSNFAATFQNQDVKIVPNAIFESDLPNEPNPLTKTVMYRGSAAYHYDVYAWAGWYQEIEKKCNNFFWVGYQPVFSKPAEKIQYIPQLPLNQYFRMGRKIGTNILWKPMLDIPFCHSKSNIAQLEATMFGGVCLTNFAGAGQWTNCLRQLSFDYSRLAATWRDSRDEILDCYRLDYWVDARANFIRELAAG